MYDSVIYDTIRYHTKIFNVRSKTDDHLAYYKLIIMKQKVTEKQTKAENWRVSDEYKKKQSESHEESPTGEMQQCMTGRRKFCGTVGEL